MLLGAALHLAACGPAAPKEPQTPPSVSPRARLAETRVSFPEHHRRLSRIRALIESCPNRRDEWQVELSAREEELAAAEAEAGALDRDTASPSDPPAHGAFEQSVAELREKVYRSKVRALLLEDVIEQSCAANVSR